MDYMKTSRVVPGRVSSTFKFHWHDLTQHAGEGAPKQSRHVRLVFDFLGTTCIFEIGAMEFSLYSATASGHTYRRPL